MEGAVRRLLRRSNDSYRLAAFPLAQALCQATGIANAQLALRHVVEAAFKNTPYESQLRELILKSAVEAHLSRTEAAAQWQVSRRHFQRYRANAVSILTAHIRELVKSVAFADTEGNGLSDPLDILATMIGTFEPVAAAQLARFGSCEFASRAYVLEMRGRLEAGQELHDSASEIPSERSRSLFAVLCAQSKQLNGKETEARVALRPLLTDQNRNLASDAEALFELEWLAFLRARHRGDTADMSRSAGNLRRIALDRSGWRSRALLAEAESSIRFGRIAEATELLDAAERLNLQAHAIGRLASTTALRAEVALLRGDDILAERLAEGAYLVLRGRHYDSYGCLTTVARARFRLKKPWRDPLGAASLSAASWDRMRISIENARHFYAAGCGDSARALAQEVFDRCVLAGFQGLTARAAATVGATFEAGSRLQREWYLKALSCHLTTRDHFTARDLFLDSGDARSIWFDVDVTAIVYASLVTTIPQLGIDSSCKTAAIGYLKQLGQYVLGAGDSPKRLEEAQERLNGASRSFTQFLLRFRNEATDVLLPAFIAIGNARNDSGVESRLRNALDVLGDQANPFDARQFLVG
jgi:hypothetical protein